MTFGWGQNAHYSESVYGKNITMVWLCKLFALDKVSCVYFQATNRASHETKGIPLVSSFNILQRQHAEVYKTAERSG